MLRWEGDAGQVEDTELDRMPIERMRLALLKGRRPFAWFCRLVPGIWEGEAVILIQTSGGEIVPVDEATLAAITEARPHLSGEVACRLVPIREDDGPWRVWAGPVRLIKVVADIGLELPPGVQTRIKMDFGELGDEQIWVACPYRPAGLPR
ncbi:MAG: hypothetical protein EA350_05375 [Gemmatimonadales bacterium]|nr:MAG: hypothetical protein EA350_05375 [Gemmatimonadales bacterium]